MGKLRGREGGGFEDQYMLVGVREMVLAANDVADAQIRIVGAGGQVVGRHAIGAQEREVLNVSGGLHLLAINGIGETHDTSSLARPAIAQSEGLSRGGATIAFLARKFPHAGIEQPSPLRARSLTVARVRGREIPVGQAFLKDGLRNLPV